MREALLDRGLPLLDINLAGLVLVEDGQRLLEARRVEEELQVLLAAGFQEVISNSISTITGMCTDATGADTTFATNCPELQGATLTINPVSETNGTTIVTVQEPWVVFDDENMNFCFNVADDRVLDLMETTQLTKRLATPITT